jgi:TonB-dependent starch-binding outer membrane protein SusC
MKLAHGAAGLALVASLASAATAQAPTQDTDPHFRSPPGALHPAGAAVDTIRPDAWAAPPPALSAAMADQSAQLHVRSASGNLGAAPRMWTRGIRSIVHGPAPLVVVDGVPMAPEFTASVLFVGGAPATRLDDLDPADVESVTVLAGPAAAARYGSAGASGVLVVRTRRPAGGAPRIEAYAGTRMLHDAAAYPANHGRWGTSWGTRTPYCTLPRESDGRCTPEAGGALAWNPLREASPFRTGVGYLAGASVSGGNAVLGYRASAGRLDEAGVLHNERRERTALSGAVVVAPGAGVRVSAAARHARTDADAPLGGRFAFSRIGAGMLGAPLDDPRWRGYSPHWPPTDDFYTSTADTRRTALSVDAEWATPVPGFTLTATWGEDVVTETAEAFFRDTEAPPLRSVTTTWEHDRYRRTLRVGGRVERALFGPVHGSLAGAWETDRQVVNRSQVSHAAGDSAGNWRWTRSSAPAAFAQGGLQWSSLRRVHATVRRDGRDHAEDPALWSYSVGAAWDVGADMAPEGPQWMQGLSLRGGAGRSERLDELAAAWHLARWGVFYTRGFSPERVTEVELGIDARLGAGGGASFTTYRQRTQDLIMWRGFSGANEGEIRNDGVELALWGAAGLARGWRWTGRATAALNRNRAHGVPPTSMGSGIYQVVTEGHPVGSIFLVPIIRQTGGPGCPFGDCAVELGTEEVPHGSVVPPRLAALTTRLHAGTRATLGVIAAYQGGAVTFNEAGWARCITSICAALYDPGAPERERVALLAAQGGTEAGYVESSDFLRLREASFTLHVPQRWSGGGRVDFTLAAHNLATWTRYSGLDPETAYGGAATLGGFDSFQRPLPRSWTTRVDVGF